MRERRGVQRGRNHEHLKALLNGGHHMHEVWNGLGNHVAAGQRIYRG